MGTAGKVSKYSNLFTSYFIHYPHYLKIKRLLDRKVFETKEQVEQYQYLQMKKIVTHAFHHVPYYRKLFSDIGFRPGDFRSLDDLLKIPLLTKEIIKENREELKAENIPEKHFKVVQTGGTTGMPAEFFLDKRYSSLTEMVFLRHMWKKLGYRQRDRCIVLREDEVAGIQEGERYWNRNLLTNWLIMSAFHLNEDTFPLFYDQIQSFKPKFILAFPSNAYLLARFIRERSLPSFPSVKGIICSSENLFDWQREYIGDVLNAPIFSFYGHSEKCILASECSDLSGYEFHPQYGYVELVNERGTGCTEENERGEIVATGFHNYVSPLIRYKTGDMATFTNEGGSDHPGGVRKGPVETEDCRLLGLRAELRQAHVGAAGVDHADVALRDEREPGPPAGIHADGTYAADRTRQHAALGRPLRGGGQHGGGL